MRNKLFFLAGIACLLLLACGQAPKPNNNLLPDLAACDSAAIMYYHEPGKPKFFNMAKTRDTAAIHRLSENVNGPLADGKDSCVTEGKVYGYGKGDAVEVVYFSRAANCMTLSFIKTGKKYFVAMDPAIKKWLDELEKIAASQ